jgi:hypothetical protein
MPQVTVKVQKAVAAVPQPSSSFRACCTVQLPPNPSANPVPSVAMNSRHSSGLALKPKRCAIWFTIAACTLADPRPPSTGSGTAFAADAAIAQGRITLTRTLCCKLPSRRAPLRSATRSGKVCSRTSQRRVAP